MEDKDTLYARWLSGELTDAERQQLEGSDTIADLKTIIEKTDQLQMPGYDAASAYEQFRKNHPGKPAKVRSLNIRLIVAVAASLALLVIALQVWNNRAIIATAKLAHTITHELPDQSQVVLNDGSSIKYQKGSWEVERTILLVGEAFFDVQKGENFTVKTANGIIEVLGTQFNVRAWGDKLYVECYEGSVKVISHQQETTLSPNQSVNVLNRQMGANQTIRHQKPLWSLGRSRFYEENINEVLAELGRQYGIQVEAPAMNRTFSGVFQHDDLENALKSICIPMKLEYTLSENKNLVTLLK